MTKVADIYFNTFERLKNEKVGKRTKKNDVLFVGTFLKIVD